MAKRAAAVSLLALALLVPAGCGGTETTGTGSAGTLPGQGAPSPRTRISADRLRDLIVRGFAEDFRAGTGDGPKGYAICVRLGLGRRLTRERIRDLLAVYRREDGGAFAAHALVRLAGSVGKSCGGARYLPEMITASNALQGVQISEPRASRLGISYGPYLGLTCRLASSTRCDRVGIDLVLKHTARSVRAIVGGRALALHTPGLNTGVRGRDWVGFLRHVGLERPGSKFRIPRKADPRRLWAGEPPVYVGVRLAIEYPGSRRVARMPHVFLSPGWG